MKLLRNLLLVVLLAFSGMLLWRWLARRRALPFPAFLARLLEFDWYEHLSQTETTLDRIGLQPGQQVLEIGPGPGRLLVRAARRVLPAGEATGLDLQPGMLTRLEERARQQGVHNLTVLLGDAAKAQLPLERFDVVFMVTVLGEIKDREAALRTAWNTLKPGGRLSITEIFPDPHYQKRDIVRRLAEGAGFHEEKSLGAWYFYTINFRKIGSSG